LGAIYRTTKRNERLYLLTVLAKGVWNLEKVVERARDYARVEFCVEIGVYKKEAMDKHNEELDLELWWGKYAGMRE
tara:strand:- start:256 stop:483 length:228 start_codon:yes stop_codon:yes gene_type:complete